MDKIKLFKSCLSKRKESLLKSLERMTDARDNAPSAMESHSDTRRSQAEKLIMSFESEVNEITRIESKIDLLQLSYIEVNINSDLKKFLIVPKGMGGTELDDIRLLSVDTPLGSQFVTKKVGDNFEFNNQKIKIVKLE